MALTGICLFIFVVVHMTGNLQFFLGPHAINHYAEFLHANAGTIWAFRLILMSIAAIHIYFAITLTIENRAKREVGYEVKKLVGASLASRTMFVSGSVIFCFLVFHILHFTTGTTNPEFLSFKDERGLHDVYKMIQTAFSNGCVVAAYIIGVSALGLHLSNGLRAICQSLGWRYESYTTLIDRGAVILAVIVSTGFALVPLLIFLGGAK